MSRRIQPPTDLAGYNPVATAPDGCWFDSDAAQLVLEFFPRFLTHQAGPAAGQPYELNPWERDVAATIFGWKRENGTRRYREAFIGIPRKNSKTTFCAGLALFGLLCDGEQAASVVCAASTRDQAKHVFSPAMWNVRKNAALATRCKILEAQNRIINGESLFKAVAADAGPLHGENISIGIIDEIHTQPNRDLYDVLKTSQAVRRQPLIISITTAGHDKESICYELWEHSRKVRDGIVDDPYFLPVVYEIRDGEDWKDPRVWARVNPNLGRSVSLEYLNEAFQRALKIPAFENTFRNLHLNEWTESAERWISSEAWDACQGEIPAELTGLKCYAGLDLASVGDITALVYVFLDDEKAYIVPHFWCPEETVKNAPKKYQRQYQRWVEQGLLVATPGANMRYEYVRDQIEADAARYNIREVAFDAWQALDTYNYLTQQVGLECVQVPQGFGGMSPLTKIVEDAILGRDLVHDGNEIMRWMVASTVVDIDNNGNRKPSKKKSHGRDESKGKIDGVIALTMALGRARQGNDDGEATYYEDHELEIV